MANFGSILTISRRQLRSNLNCFQCGFAGSLLSWIALLLVVVMVVIFIGYRTPYFANIGLSALQQLPVTVNRKAALAQQSNLFAQLTFNLQQPTAYTLSQLGSIVAPYQPSTQPLWPQDILPPANAQQRYITAPNQPIRPPRNNAAAIVVLGGGLTLNAKGDIIVNHYTASRLNHAVRLQKNTQLPILLSGVEAPYMQKWLTSHGFSALYTEANSFNTCENARFSALLLLKYGGARTVYVVTDAYHMPRARRLFGLNGISTIASAAPINLSSATPQQLSAIYNRRTLYELGANIRDSILGVNCRQTP